MVWVRLPRVEAGESGAVADMHWGSPLSWDRPAPTDVWTGDFVGVWPLADGRDATLAANDGVASGVLFVDGRVGRAARFGGAGYIEAPRHYTLNSGDGSFTISAWIRKENLANMIALAHGNGFSRGEWSVGWGTDDIAFRSDNVFFRSEDGAMAAGQWRHAAFVRDDDGLSIAIDGEVTTGPIDMSEVRDLTGQAPLFFGVRDDGRFPFSGEIDEVRLESVARSPDWIRAAFLSQTPGSGFLTFDPASPCHYPRPPAAACWRVYRLGATRPRRFGARAGSDGGWWFFLLRPDASGG